jgi:hypothetical protein
MHGFSTRCLRFTNRVASAHARLTSGWLASLCREGVEPSGLLRKVSVLSLHHFPLSKAYPDASWAHTRRKFHDIFAATQSPTASEAIRRIGELYAIEKEVRGSPPEIRLAIQASQSQAGDGRSTSLVRRDTSDPLGQERHGRSDPLCDLAMDRAHPLSRRWSSRDRQQRRRTRVARRRVRSEEITSSLDRTGEANAPPPSTRSSERPSSTDSTRSSISAMSSPESQITPLTASQNCCLGTSHSFTQKTSRLTPNKCPPK